MLPFDLAEHGHLDARGRVPDYGCIKALKNRDNSEGTLDWLGRWRPDRFDPAKIKFWSPLRRLKIALED